MGQTQHQTTKHSVDEVHPSYENTANIAGHKTRYALNVEHSLYYWLARSIDNYPCLRFSTEYAWHSRGFRHYVPIVLILNVLQHSLQLVSVTAASFEISLKQKTNLSNGALSPSNTGCSSRWSLFEVTVHVVTAQFSDLARFVWEFRGFPLPKYSTSGGTWVRYHTWALMSSIVKRWFLGLRMPLIRSLHSSETSRPSGNLGPAWTAFNNFLWFVSSNGKRPNTCSKKQSRCCHISFRKKNSVEFAA